MLIESIQIHGPRSNQTSCQQQRYSDTPICYLFGMPLALTVYHRFYFLPLWYCLSCSCELKLFLLQTVGCCLENSFDRPFIRGYLMDQLLTLRNNCFEVYNMAVSFYRLENITSNLIDENSDLFWDWMYEQKLNQTSTLCEKLNQLSECNRDICGKDSLCKSS